MGSPDCAGPFEVHSVRADENFIEVAATHTVGTEFAVEIQ
jgi:hypothetical protein